MENASVVERAKSGDENAFKLLIEECSPKIRTLLRHQYRLQEPDLDDVILIASNKAWTKINSFRGDSKFVTWFYTIVRNEVVNFLKKRNLIDKHEVSAHHTYDYGHDEDGDYENILHDSIDKQLNETAVSLLEHQEMLNTYKVILEDILAKLSEEHRQIIKMVFEEEKSYKEIAEELNIPIGTVMSRLFFARQHAKKLIKHYATHHDIQLACLGQYK